MKRRGLIAGLAVLTVLPLSVGPAAANPKVGGAFVGSDGCGASWEEAGVIEGGRIVYVYGFQSDFSDCVPSV
ncbi:MAG: hypothetical protein M3285_02725 [Actinomycetota bacterium]|nr:hypothetical protein [Actinomycetota bacterium]